MNTSSFRRTAFIAAAAAAVALAATACTVPTAGRPIGSGPATTRPAAAGLPTTGAPIGAPASGDPTTQPSTPSQPAPDQTQPSTPSQPSQPSQSSGTDQQQNTGSNVDLIATLLAGADPAGGQSSGSDSCQPATCWTGPTRGQSQALASFRSVSGNIACTMLGAADGQVACTIYQHEATGSQNWPDTSCTDGPVTIRSDVAGGVISTGCASDQPQSTAASWPVLGYGHSLYAGNYACLDASAGVTCVNLNTDSGFRLAQQGYFAIAPPNPANECSTADLGQTSVPGGIEAGTYSVSAVRTTSTGPLWADFIASSPQSEDGAEVIAYCSSSGWQGVSALSNGLSCVPSLTPRQFDQLGMASCVTTKASYSGPQPATPEYPSSVPPVTRLATSACRTWAYADELDAAHGGFFYQVGASQARDAADLDSQWGQLADWTSFLASLPETSNTPANVNRAERIEPQLKQTCGQLGVQLLG